MASGGASRRVIRCNVNNLLLAVIVLESVFLGWYLLCWLSMAPSLGELPPTPMNESVTKKMDKLPIKVQPPAEDYDGWTASGLATCEFVTGLVFFLIQLLALANLILGYQRQNHKPLGIFFVWLILSSLIIIVAWIWLAVVAESWLPAALTTSGHKTMLTTRNKGTGDEGMVEVPDNAPKGPVLEMAKRTAHRVNCFLIPLLVLKIVTFVFELFAVFMAIKYFKGLQPVPAAANEEKAPAVEMTAAENNENEKPAAEEEPKKDEEKEALVENA